MLGHKVVLAVAITLWTSVAFAQAQTATAPANGSTGPTLPETRPVDQRSDGGAGGVPSVTPHMQGNTDNPPPARGQPVDRMEGKQ